MTLRQAFNVESVFKDMPVKDGYPSIGEAGSGHYAIFRQSCICSEQ